MTMTQPDVTALWKELQSRVDAGDRFAGLFATKPEGGPLVLSAHVAVKGEGEAGGASTRSKRRCRPARPAIPRSPRGWAPRSGTSARSTTTSA